MYLIIMDKNVFVKNKKYNPDININYNKVMNERENVNFKYTNQFMNKNNINDKKLYDKDTPANEIDLLIKKKLDERTKQEFDFKPSKDLLPSSNPADFKEYNDLKNQQTRHEEKNKNNESSFNNILNDLQDLGILKK